jgi:hypothetical protein
MSHSAKKLAKIIQSTQQQVQVGQIYSHYKSPEKSYTIIAVGLIEETETPCVIYQAQYGEKLVWVRTLNNFLEEVEYEGQKYPGFR